MKNIFRGFFFYLGYISLKDASKYDDRLSVRFTGDSNFLYVNEPVVDYEYLSDVDELHFTRRFGEEAEILPVHTIAEISVKDYKGSIIMDKPAGEHSE